MQFYGSSAPLRNGIFSPIFGHANMVFKNLNIMSIIKFIWSYTLILEW